MKAETQLAKLIEVTDQKVRYDTQAKKLLANEAILAWILKTCTEEFAPYSPEEIIPCIEGRPEVSERAVHTTEPDLAPQKNAEMQERESMLSSNRLVEGVNTEDSSLKEPTVYYDIRLNASAPGNNGRIHLIINVEAQKKTNLKYPIEKRAIYYCCRLISAQYGTVFEHSEYGKLRKVYSIWFCAEPAKGKQNTIQKLSIEESFLYGKGHTSRRNIDLLQVVIVNLGDPNEAADHPILRLMNSLLSLETGAREKKRVLQEEFHIAMTVELEREVSELCNLSEGIYNKGLKDGIDKGIQQGLEQGIKVTVEILQESGFEQQIILEKIMKKYHLTLETAKQYVPA